MFLRGVRESTLAGSHGLQTGNWTSVFAQAKPDIGNIMASTLTGGAFAEFVNATANTSLLTHNSSLPNFAYTHPPVPTGTPILLDDILSRLPELGAQYTRWRGLPKFCPVDELRAQEPTTDIWISQKLHGFTIDRQFIEAFFTTSSPIFQSDQNNQIWYKSSTKSSDLPPFWDHRNHAFGAVGDLVLLKDFGGAQLSKPAAVLALAYILGMLVRYFPSKWMSLVRNEIGDAGLPTILLAIEYVDEWFPQLVLEHFERDLIGL
ncbi:hypothetical protein BSZ19_18715 [Bradyrhizobium japonicum]|uniref:Uncharacterized protein n=2 Tax=Bradyrhizobium japonicum TaxID=375 RepID=A0A1Y2JP18_BRAJP|nr:hypothetical protein BSZ19_18715 [Bradyrhizobium japonicum]